jgi:hypothetical protein
VLEGLQRRAGLAPGKDGPPAPSRVRGSSFQGGRPRSLRSRRASASIRASYALKPLAFVTPQIVEAIVQGRQPAELTAETLTNSIDSRCSGVFKGEH